MQLKQEGWVRVVQNIEEKVQVSVEHLSVERVRVCEARGVAHLDRAHVVRQGLAEAGSSERWSVVVEAGLLVKRRDLWLRMNLG